MLGQIDLTHSPATEQSQDPISSKQLTVRQWHTGILQIRTQATNSLCNAQAG